MILLTVATLMSQAPVAAPVPDPADPIVVTGKQRKKPQVKPPLGSRIGRPAEPDPRGFVSQIATDSGVAGLVPGSGMDPFSGGTRKVTRKTCKADNPQLSAAALCDLAAIGRKIANGDKAGALAAIHRLCERADVTALDCLAARRFQYAMAQAAGDAGARRDAIEAMLETRALPAADQAAARRALVTMAVARGDDREAMAQLERITRDAPGDVSSQANLGALYARHGMHDRARARIADAVRFAAAAGRPVPQAWRDYLAEVR